MKQWPQYGETMIFVFFSIEITDLDPLFALFAQKEKKL